MHYRPSFMNSLIHNRRMQKWFEHVADEQFRHEVDLPDGVGSICVPTLEFNLIYQLSHIYRHLFSEGIGLRQLMDYYYLLHQIELNHQSLPQRNQLAMTLHHLHLYKFAGAVMWVLHEVFRLEKERLIVQPNERDGKFLLNEILIGGNFGRYDTRLGHKEQESKLHRYFRMTLRNMRFVRHYPSEALCEPLFRTWHFVWRVCNKFYSRHAVQR